MRDVEVTHQVMGRLVVGDDQYVTHLGSDGLQAVVQQSFSSSDSNSEARPSL